MEYRPKDYWTARGRTYMRDFDSKSGGVVHRAKYQTQARLLLGVLEPLPFTSVLEVGCGFGRVTRLIVDRFPGVVSYDALDISPDQLTNAGAYVGSNKVTFHCMSFQDFDLAGRKYDLVIASEVLLHVLPAEIAKFMERMVSASQRDLVHIDWDPLAPPSAFAPHNFPHDYRKLYRDMGEKIRRLDTVRVRGRIFSFIPKDFGQTIFHASVS